MTKVVLVRHGETEGNVEKRLLGLTDCPLNQAGLDQAERHARRLALCPFKFHRLVASPLARAMQTARVIGKTLNLDVVAVSELREANYGVFDGMPMDDLKENPEFQRRELDRFRFTPTGGESYQALYVRCGDVIGALQDINHVIVSHLGTMRMLYAILKGLDPEDCTKISFEHEATVLFEHENGRWLESEI